MATGQADPRDEFTSPGGFVFGVQGWTWGEQRPTTITFFLDGTVRVCDQHGRPIKGTVDKNNRPVYFDRSTHEQVISALADERIDWQALTHAGWPQLPYSRLKEVKKLPPTPVAELRKIPDPSLRRDALRMRTELDEAEKAEGREDTADDTAGG